MRLQSAIEFLTTYSWAFVIIGIFVVSILSLVLFPKGSATYAPESCYITPELPCYQALILSNATAAKFLILLQNNLGVGLLFKANSISVVPSYYQNTSYNGNCYPQNSVPGSTIICNVSIPGVTLVIGSQLNPRFTITYQLCAPACTKQVYNTSGTAVTAVTPYSAVTSPVSLVTNPANGQIAVDGVRYYGGNTVIFITGVKYNVYAVPPPGNVFSTWASVNVILGNAASQSTVANAFGPGSLTANFVHS